LGENLGRDGCERTVVRAPASTANLGPGFDVFGLALDVMYDIAEVIRLDEKIVTVEMRGVEADTIPADPESNSAGRTALEFVNRYNKGGFKIKITKGIPPGSGLGSSGASAAATAVAISHMLGLKLPTKELIEIAACGEIATAGAPHADNVAPSICGGFVIIRSYDPLEVVTFPPPEKLEFALAVPKGMKKTTKKARSVLPRSIPLIKAVDNIGAASLVVAGLFLSDPYLVGYGMMGDQIVEPARALLYPGYLDAKKAALDSGAVGATLSGAGPTVIAIADPEKVGSVAVANAMKEAFEAKGIECYGYVSRPTVGAQIVCR